MRGRCFVVGVALLALPLPSEAHELDEYLQASRVSLERHRVTCDIDLTPGADVAAAVLAVIDRDADRLVTPAEAESYGRAVLRDLTLELDGRVLPLTLEHVDVPAFEEMTGGVGTIQVRAVADIQRLAAGRRRIYFRNNHGTSEAVYLVNALAPADPDIIVAGQRRDRQQHEIRLEYDVRPATPVQAAWLLVAGLGLCTLVVWRRSRTEPRTPALNRTGFVGGPIR